MIANSFIIALFTLVTTSAFFVSSLPVTTDSNVFHSKVYPNLTVTFKTPNLCDPTVKQYSGYVDVSENDHYFFWFFESRQQPEKAPLTIYLNGGPGASSMVGVWQEMGPCRVNEDGSQAIYNEKGSWNKISNMLFIDQPSSTGFSYGSSNITTTKEATKYIYTFIQLFLEAFTQYQHNDVLIYGESFGGHFVPAYGDYFIQQNQLNDSNHIPINLKSAGIGNGLTDPLIQNQYLEKMACNSTYGSVLTKDMCEVMKLNTPICTKLTEKCYQTNENQDCLQAFTYCTLSVQYVYFNSGRSVYDVRVTKDEPETYINFLNKTSTLETIGARKPYNSLNTEVTAKFGATGDFMRTYAPQVANLLNNGVKVLVYSGDSDFICTWYGGHAWTNQLKFKNNQIFQKDQLKPWYVGDKEAGQIQQGGNLTFLRVYQASHYVAIDQPEVALKMFIDQVQSIQLNK